MYAGGVIIFVIFTILLTSHLGESALHIKLPRTFIALVISLAFLWVMVRFVVLTPDLNVATPTATSGYASLSSFALRLLSIGQEGFVIPFEIISLLLLVTLVCAITIARKSKGEE